MSGLRITLCIGFSVILGMGCMSEVVRARAEFKPFVDHPTIVLARPARVSVRGGFDEDLAAGSKWRLLGSIAQGEVYRPVGTVFMVSGANAHEAYLVVFNGQLLGFYLPGEGSFAPASKPVALELPEKGEQ